MCEILPSEWDVSIQVTEVRREEDPVLEEIRNKKNKNKRNKDRHDKHDRSCDNRHKP